MTRVLRKRSCAFWKIIVLLFYGSLKMKKDDIMIKDNQQHFNRLHVIIDAFVIVVSYILAWWLKFSSGILDSPGGALSFGFYMKALVVIVPLYLILYYAFNLYTPKRVQGRRLEFSNVVMANIVGFLLILQYCTTCSLMWISFEIFP